MAPYSAGTRREKSQAAGSADCRDMVGAGWNVAGLCGVMNRVGFIGLGNVGLPAAINLLSSGFEVYGFDIRPSEAFTSAGGHAVQSVADLCELPIIFQSLPNAQVFRDTTDIFVARPSADRVIVELSSYALSIKHSEAARLAECGSTLLDCEMSGLPHQVRNRSAVIFKSGPKTTIDGLEPLFDAIASKHFYLGEFGAATKMKLVANMMDCVHDLMAAEALALGSRIGLDPAQMIEVLGPSAAGSTTFLNKAPLMVARSFAEGRGPFRHMFGYLARAQEVARESGAATPLLDATRDIFAIAEAEGRHQEDIAAIFEVIEALGEKR